MNRYLRSKKKEHCCGCNACIQICPVKCIHSRLDQEGFCYPVADEESCINCRMCSKVCPMEPENNCGNESKALYAGVICKDDILKDSSSGGAFSAIAEYILDNNGVVCGCILDKGHQAKHIIIDEKDKLAKLRGSKYVQSDLHNIYSSIKKILEHGRTVLFVGTPCQVAGLNLFIGKPHIGLITVDLICHGVPSQMFLDRWIEYEEKKRKAKIMDLKFRDKEKYGWSNVISFKVKEGKKLLQPPSINSYYYAYLNALNYRETCYECPFTTTQRTGDLTIADFWGIENENLEIDQKEGVSMILVNTHKGNKMMGKLERSMKLYPCDIASLSQRQTQLRAPVCRQSSRDDIYNMLQKTSYEEIQKKYLRSKRYPYYLLASKVPKWLRDFIKK